MEIWQAIVLGFVQGFTEFLPVSSSGHLMLLQNWFGIEENVLFYSVMLHIGTLIPVVIVLWKQIVGLFKDKWKRFWFLVLASIPAGVVGLIFEKLIGIENVFADNIYLLSITFTLTAIELLFAEYYCKKNQMTNKINPKTGLIMGIGQAFGVLPGLSRSGATITFGCLAKVDREENASFTFLMSIPIILAAVFLSTVDCITEGTIGNVEVVPLLFGVLASAVCGYIAIKFMLGIVKKANYKWFSLYLILLSVANVIVYVV